MNREINFRIWDIENKEMLKVQELDFEPTFYGGRIAIRPDQYSDYFDTEDMILMQYTGFHDRFGNEIYENDIVYVLSEDENAIIEWDEQTAKFIIHFDGWIADFSNYYGKELEIMGDIYNNPELLGGEYYG
jgi:uncharacterized phage protein (TIGR01671 family)